MSCFRQELNRLQEAGIVDTIERNGERSKLKFNKEKRNFCKNKIYEVYPLLIAL